MPELTLTEKQTALVFALANHPDGAAPATLAGELDSTPAAVQKALKRLLPTGLLTWDDVGTYGLSPDGERFVRGGEEAEPPPAPVPVTAFEARMVALDRIDPSPFQRRRFSDRPTEQDLEMIASIQAHGVLEPVLLRPSPGDPDRFELCGGERRCRNATRAGLLEVPAIIRPYDDDAAAEVIAIENLQRQDLDWREASDTIAMLVERPGWTVETVAQHTGRNVHWVARMASLQRLSAAWREAVEDPEHPAYRFSASHLAVISRLPEDTQDAILAEHLYLLRREPTVAELEHAVGQMLRLLRKAPWNLKDELLVPAAGPCSRCPKRTSVHPLLFEDLAEDGPEKDDRCLDGVCWAGKLRVHLDRKVGELRERHGKILLVRERGYVNESKSDPLLAEAMPEWRVHQTRKDAEGAVPVLRVDGAGAGTWYWGQEPVVSSHGGIPSGRTAGPKPLRDKVLNLDVRRKRRAIELVVAQLDASKPPEMTEALSLVLAFGTHFRFEGLNSWEANLQYAADEEDDDTPPFDETSDAADDLDEESFEPKTVAEQGAWRMRSIPQAAVDAEASQDPFLKEPDTEAAKTKRWSVFDAYLRDLREAKPKKKARPTEIDLWRAVAPVLIRRLGYYTGCDITTMWYESKRLAALFGIDAAAALERAHREIKEPRSWKAEADYGQVREDLAHLFTVEAAPAAAEASA